MNCGRCTSWQTAGPGRYINTGHRVKSKGELMLPTYVVERVYELKYLIHMCTKTCTAGTDSRTFALCGYVATKTCHRQAVARALAL